MTRDRWEASKGRTWAPLALAGWALATTVAGVGCGRADGAQVAAVSPPSRSTETPVPVRLAAVEHARRARPVHAVGVLAAKEEVKLSFKLGGLVERLNVDEGAFVRSGQLLASLRLPEIDAGVAQAREGRAKAERDLTRVTSLYEGKAATLEQLQNARTAVEVAEATLAAATFNRAHAVIEAPADGKIVRRLAEKDEAVAPGAPVFLFRSTRRGWVIRGGVSDKDVVRVALGDAATVRWDALPGRAFAATVSEIAESANPLTGTYELELRLKEAEPTLRAGLIASLEIQPAARESYAFVPIEALQEGQGMEASVFVPSPDGHHAVKRRVTLASLDATGAQLTAAVSQGLEGVPQIVVDGAGRLSDGSAIAGVAP